MSFWLLSGALLCLFCYVLADVDKGDFKWYNTLPDMTGNEHTSDHSTFSFSVSKRSQVLVAAIPSLGKNDIKIYNMANSEFVRNVTVSIHESLVCSTSIAVAGDGKSCAVTCFNIGDSSVTFVRVLRLMNNNYGQIGDDVYISNNVKDQHHFVCELNEDGTVLAVSVNFPDRAPTMELFGFKDGMWDRLGPTLQISSIDPTVENFLSPTSVLSLEGKSVSTVSIVSKYPKGGWAMSAHVLDYDNKLNEWHNRGLAINFDSKSKSRICALSGDAHVVAFFKQTFSGKRQVVAYNWTPAENQWTTLGKPISLKYDNGIARNVTIDLSEDGLTLAVGAVIVRNKIQSKKKNKKNRMVSPKFNTATGLMFRFEKGKWVMFGKPIEEKTINKDKGSVFIRIVGVSRIVFGFFLNGFNIARVYGFYSIKYIPFNVANKISSDIAERDADD